MRRIPKCVPINWINNRERRPLKSGNYLVYTQAASVMSLDFSVEHNRWNCSDLPDEIPSYAIEADSLWIVAWADTNALDKSLRPWKEENSAEDFN